MRSNICPEVPSRRSGDDGSTSELIMRAVAAAPWALECEGKGGRSSASRVYVHRCCLRMEGVGFSQPGERKGMLAVRNLPRPTPFETRLLGTWYKQARHHRSEMVYSGLQPRFLTTNCHWVNNRAMAGYLMNIDARSAGPPSFSLALQSPRSCSNCAHYQLRSAPVIAASARWLLRAYV